MKKDKLKVTIYRLTGRQLFFKVKKEICEECDLTVNVVERVIENLGRENVELEVKPWMNNILHALIKRAWHPPIVLIDGKVFSQGTVPGPNLLESKTIEKLRQKGIDPSETT